jgi:hypothetical protein
MSETQRGCGARIRRDSHRYLKSTSEVVIPRPLRPTAEAIRSVRNVRQVQA